MREFGKVLREKMGVGSICCAMQYEKGRKGDKLGKTILRRFLVYSESEPILPFSEIPEKIQINFQLLSNDTVLRWAQEGPRFTQVYK